MSTPSVNPLNQHITQTPGICGGKPCIAGSRIRVQDIYVWHELQSRSVEEIITKFPQLTHADVYAALTYFWDNRQDAVAGTAYAFRADGESGEDGSNNPY